MKKMLFTMIALLSIAVSSQAMSYEQARQKALFLADKMAYELNLSEEQYEACYEVNLDYFMGITTYDDLYGDYWTRRNIDLSYILLDWQYQTFIEASYFYRPLYWNAGSWHFGIYSRYPRRDYYYYGCPVFFDVYRGGHAWHVNNSRSWYHGRDFGHRGRTRNHSYGMRDGFNNGNYGRGGNLRDYRGNFRRVESESRGIQSSTRSTAGYRERTDRGAFDNNQSTMRFGGSRMDCRESNFNRDRGASMQRQNVERSFGSQGMSRSAGSSMGRFGGSSMGRPSNGNSRGSFGGTRR